MRACSRLIITFLALLMLHLSAAAQPDVYVPENIRDTTVDGKRARAIYRMVFRNNPPLPREAINDWNKSLKKEEKEVLLKQIAEQKNLRDVEVVFVVADTLCTKKETFADVSSRIANRWVLNRTDTRKALLIALCPGYGVAAIEDGFGAEKLFTEDQKKFLLEQVILPRLKSGSVLSAASAVLPEIDKIRSGNAAQAPE